MAQIPGSQGLGEVVPRPASYREVNVSAGAFGADTFRSIEGAGADVRRQELFDQQQADALRRAEDQQALAERRAADKAQALTVLQRTTEDLALSAEEMGQGVLGGSVDKAKAGEEWGTRSKERIAEALKGVPAEHRALVQSDLDHRGAVLSRTKIGASVRQRNRDDTRSGISQTLEHAQRLYATDPGAAEKLMSGTLDALGPAAQMGADDIAKTKQGWREKTQYTTGYEAVSAGRDDRKALDRAEAIIKKLPDLDPQQRITLLDRAQNYRVAIDNREDAMARRFAAESERILKRAEHEFKAFQALADKGTMLDPAYIDRAAQATAGTPYAAAIRGLADQARITGGLAAQPIAAQQSMLDQVNAQIAQQGRTPGLDARKDQVEKVLRGSRDDFERDPLRAALERGVIAALEPLNMAGGVQGLIPQLTDRVTAAQRVQQWAGSPVSPLTGDEAIKVKSLLDTMPVKERSVLVSAMAAALGPQQAQGMAAQMDKKDRALALALAAGGAQTTENRLTSELILRGQQARVDGTSTKGLKEPEVKSSGWRARAATELEGVFGNEAFTTQVRDAAELIMHGIAAEQGGRLSGRDMERAVELAIGGKIVEHAGRRIPLPAGVDLGMLEKRLESITTDEIGRQALVPLADGQAQDMKKLTVRAGGVEIPVADFVKSLPGQQLMPVRPGEFAVLVGGRPVVNSRGVPIIVKVR